MIGVACKPTERETAREFFELFKTPWEVARRDRQYRVVLSTVGRPDGIVAQQLLLYGATKQATDLRAGVTVERFSGVTEVEWDDLRFPLYRGALFFSGAGPAVLWSAGHAVDYRGRADDASVWRIGYDLFDEVGHLLTVGQPPSRARTPTLELHIALLRHLLLESGMSFVEVPPRPAGCDFICCLTHDIDFFGITRHVFDRTLAGFVVRASLGTLADVVRRRRPLADAVRNWAALLSLPLVFLGLAPDFWRPIADFARADNGRPSTFFVVPFRDRPGIAPDGGVEARRAVKYQASEVAAQLKAASADGNELAVHGIDAWRDAGAGREELAELLALTGRSTAGIRMHWLYFSADSPHQLEAAGFDYDSTWGYSEAVGYRAGTSQVFCLPGTNGLMELPLCVMDSAMFFPTRMALPRANAAKLCKEIVSIARLWGGTLVINWHDRSTAPERLWGEAYRTLLEEIQLNGRVWYATGTQAVQWFRWRRAIRFSQEAAAGGPVEVLAPPATQAGGIARVHRLVGGRVELRDRPLDGPARIDL